MMLLFNYTFDCHLAFKIFNQGIDFIPSCINTVFGTFQRYLRKMTGKKYFWNCYTHYWSIKPKSIMVLITLH